MTRSIKSSTDSKMSFCEILGVGTNVRPLLSNRVSVSESSYDDRFKTLLYLLEFVLLSLFSSLNDSTSYLASCWQLCLSSGLDLCL